MAAILEVAVITGVMWQSGVEKHISIASLHLKCDTSLKGGAYTRCVVMPIVAACTRWF